MGFNLSLSASLLFTLVILSNAQQHKSPFKSNASVPQIGASRLPFDPLAEKLPPNFSGHNIKSLYNEMSTRSTGAKKGEFETTQEFHARVERESMAPVLGGLNKDGVFAFTLTNSSGEVIYDADQQVMTIAVALSKASKDIYTESTQKALTSQVEIDKEMYEGSNAMGAKVQVTRRLGKNYEVAINNYSNFGMRRYLGSLTRSLGYTSDLHAKDAIVISIPMEIAVAKRVKDHLKVLGLVRLREPYTFAGTFYSKPTFKRPEEYFVQYYYLSSDLLELWVYDNTTGQIFAKEKPNQ